MPNDTSLAAPVVVTQKTVKVACLMGTYGRYPLMTEAIAGFLGQTALEDAKLLVFNQHPVALHFDHPRVRVVNEEMLNVGLRHIRRRMFDLEGDAEFIHWWEDDDLYLPWHIEDCLANIGSNIAWRPKRSWLWLGTGEFEMWESRMEGAWLIRRDIIAEAPLDPYPTYPDIPINEELWQTNRVANTDVGDFASYIYRWGTNTPHLTQQVYEKDGDIVASVNAVRRVANDVPVDGRLVMPDMTPRWRQFLDGIDGKVSPENHAILTQRLLREGTA